MENEWVQWSKYVLKSLEKNEKDHEKMMENLVKLQEDITILKAKAAVIGFIAGMIPTAVLILLKVFEHI